MPKLNHHMPKLNYHMPKLIQITRLSTLLAGNPSLRSLATAIYVTALGSLAGLLTLVANLFAYGVSLSAVLPASSSRASLLASPPLSSYGQRW